MPHVASSAADLLTRLDGIVRVEADRLAIRDEARLRSEGIRDLAWTAAFTSDEGAAAAAQWLVWEASQALGARSSSIHELYAARGRGDWTAARSAGDDEGQLGSGGVSDRQRRGDV